MPAFSFERTANTTKNEAETQAYLDGVWKDKIRWIRRLAVIDALVFLASLGYLYLSLKIPEATLDRPIADGLCGVSVSMTIIICVGYWLEKLSHAQKSEGMLKISRQ